MFVAIDGACVCYCCCCRRCCVDDGEERAASKREKKKNDDDDDNESIARRCWSVLMARTATAQGRLDNNNDDNNNIEQHHSASSPTPSSLSLLLPVVAAAANSSIDTLVSTANSISSRARSTSRHHQHRRRLLQLLHQRPYHAHTTSMPSSSTLCHVCAQLITTIPLHSHLIAEHARLVASALLAPNIADPIHSWLIGQVDYGKAFETVCSNVVLSRFCVIVCDEEKTAMIVYAHRCRSLFERTIGRHRHFIVQIFHNITYCLLIVCIRVCCYSHTLSTFWKRPLSLWIDS